MQSHSGHSTKWTQYAVDTVRSGIVLYGGGDIVLDTKSSNQWTQSMQYAVDAVRSGHSMQWTQYAVDAVE